MIDRIIDRLITLLLQWQRRRDMRRLETISVGHRPFLLGKRGSRWRVDGYPIDVFGPDDEAFLVRNIGLVPVVFRAACGRAYSGMATLASFPK